MAFDAISGEKQKALEFRMKSLGVSEIDLEEKFVQAQGPGGQNVNKVASCVQLIHVPSGVSVKCQVSRSQRMNRYHARRLLLDEIERRRESLKRERINAQERKRRQNRKRPVFLKEVILEKKRRQSEKKKSRREFKSGSWKIDE